MVELESDSRLPISDDTPLRVRSAFDEKIKLPTVGEFVNDCVQYLHVRHGAIVNMRYLPKIADGEIRVILVHQKPVLVVEKVRTFPSYLDLK